MATRSAITIISGAHKISLYRHWDGYPAESIPPLLVAACVARQSAHNLQSHWSVVEAANSLLRRLHPATTYSEARPMYELTTSAKDHGDLDWVYTLRLFANGAQLMVEHRDLHADKWSADFVGNAAEAAEYCNADRDAINQRAKVNGPQDDPYPLIDATGREVARVDAA